MSGWPLDRFLGLALLCLALGLVQLPHRRSKLADQVYLGTGLLANLRQNAVETPAHLKDKLVDSRTTLEPSLESFGSKQPSSIGEIEIRRKKSMAVNRCVGHRSYICCRLQHSVAVRGGSIPAMVDLNVVILLSQRRSRTMSILQSGPEKHPGKFYPSCVEAGLS